MFGHAVAGDAAGEQAWAAVLSGGQALRQGDSGPAVDHLQSLLIAKGHAVAQDGDFGGGTDRAVRAFQIQTGVAVDGVVGVGTATALSGPSTGSRPVGPQQDGGGQGGQGTMAGGQQQRDRTVGGIEISPNAFERTGLRPGVFAKALDAFRKAFADGESTSMVVTVIDYELPSDQKRFWVINLEEKKILFQEYTSHGSGSDRNHDGRADKMSNVSESGTSNVGLLKTAETYTGKHGKSLKLDGLEEGFNDNARDRHIVVHSASYVDDRYIAQHGKAGRSLGCPALDPDVSGQIIDTIKGGKLVFAYYPDPRWLRSSEYLNGGQS
jgi:peptidoglycan hydrolase-like protein with peptidoglycan-binding domain